MVNGPLCVGVANPQIERTEAELKRLSDGAEVFDRSHQRREITSEKLVIRRNRSGNTLLQRLQEKTMAKSKQPSKGKPGSKQSPDALTKTKKSQIELSEADLKRVAGGAAPKVKVDHNYKY